MKKILDYIAIGFVGLVVVVAVLAVVGTLLGGLWQALVVQDKDSIIVMSVIAGIAMLFWSFHWIDKREKEKEQTKEDKRMEGFWD